MRANEFAEIATGEYMCTVISWFKVVTAIHNRRYCNIHIGMDQHLRESIEEFTSTFKILQPILTLGVDVACGGEIQWNELRRIYRYDDLLLCFFVFCVRGSTST